jgi:hypothetical protein
VVSEKVGDGRGWGHHRDLWQTAAEGNPSMASIGEDLAQFLWEKYSQRHSGASKLHAEARGHLHRQHPTSLELGFQWALQRRTRERIELTS